MSAQLVNLPETPPASRKYGTEGFKEDPKLDWHYAERAEDITDK